MQTRVGVLRGGPSSEYDISLKTGSFVLQNIPTKYTTRDILISKDGVWHMDGMEITPERALSQVDVIFNALHGTYGEDGKVQRILETHKVPFTGSGSYGSAMAMNKALAKNILHKEGVSIPYAMVADSDENPREVAQTIFETFGGPWIVKAVSGGSSHGIYVAKTLTDLQRILTNMFNDHESVLVEELISGTEVTCGVIDNFRGQEHYTTLPIEIVKNGDLFDTHQKYEANVTHVCPPRLSDDLKEEIQRIALCAHKSLGLKHYSRTDMIIRPNGKIYFLETNSLPGLTDHSLLPHSLKQVGCHGHHLIDHLVQLAIKN